MKPIVLLLSLFAITNLSAQTTLEEYNYVIKGYKIQQESGLDMKKGYKLTDITNVSSASPEERKGGSNVYPKKCQLAR